MLNLLNDVEGLSFLIFYGSQLGQAKSIAEGLVDVAQGYELVTKALELNDIKDVAALTKLTCPIVIITSTTGDGEPPESADKFWRKLRRKSLSPGLLTSVNYAILGLGDTNYNQFCNCGKTLHKRLQELGAETFYPPAWADDAVGLDLTVDDWIENLWPVLLKIIRPDFTPSDMEKTSLTVPSCPPLSLNLEWLEGEGDARHRISKHDLLNPLAPYPLIDGEPVEVSMKKCRTLTKPNAVKTALEITFEFVGKSFEFEPGDAFNLICPNSDIEIGDLLSRLNLSSHSEKTLQLSVKEGAKGKLPAYIPATVTLLDIFRHYLDIRSCPKKNFLRLLAEFTSDDSEKSKLLHLCSRQGSADFETTIRFAALSLLDILLTFPSCNPPLEALLEHLPRLAPRAYSISSSPLINTKSFAIAFNIVIIPKENGRKYDRLGVCTGWLAEKSRTFLSSGAVENIDELEKAMSFLSVDPAKSSNTDVNSFIIYKRKNQNFRLPQGNPPIIMVGPGTGVAPFVGFVEHNHKLIEKNGKGYEMTLYFGCRNKTKDFLYEDDLNFYKSVKALASLYPVFSRDDADAKVKYVQHRMEENKEEVVSTLFSNGGYLYVCGDARNMAKDVRETLISCVKQVKNITETEAKAMVAELTTGKKYLQDIWT